MMEAVRTSETSVDNYFTRQFIPENNSPWLWRQYIPLKRRSTIILHGITSQKTILPYDGGSTYLWNVGRKLFYTAVHPRRQFSLMMEAVRASETSADNYFTRQYIPEDNSPLWWRQYVPLKRRSTIILHGSTSQKTILNIWPKQLALPLTRVWEGRRRCSLRGTFNDATWSIDITAFKSGAYLAARQIRSETGLHNV
jgi:hypothetical protein